MLLDKSLQENTQSFAKLANKALCFLMKKLSNLNHP